jgi:hypothetical protein
MDFSVHQRKGVLTDESAMQSDEWMDVPLSNIQKCAVMGGFKSHLAVNVNSFRIPSVHPSTLP